MLTSRGRAKQLERHSISLRITLPLASICLAIVAIGPSVINRLPYYSVLLITLSGIFALSASIAVLAQLIAMDGGSGVIFLLVVATGLLTLAYLPTGTVAVCVYSETNCNPAIFERMGAENLISLTGTDPLDANVAGQGITE